MNIKVYDTIKKEYLTPPFKMRVNFFGELELNCFDWYLNNYQSPKTKIPNPDRFRIEIKEDLKCKDKSNIIKIEKKLDEINADYGSKEEYCIFCKCKEYNSKVGIVHKEDCIILELREEIKKHKI